MSRKISFCFGKRAKLTKIFYKNPSDSSKELLMIKFIECFNLIIAAKEKIYQKKTAQKLDNPLGASKAFWSILNIFFGKKVLII